MFQTGQHTPVSEVATSLSAVETTPRMPVVLDDKVTPSLLKREHNDNNDKITELLNKIKMEDLLSYLIQQNAYGEYKRERSRKTTLTKKQCLKDSGASVQKSV